jgi:hypothetical protein
VSGGEGMHLAAIALVGGLMGTFIVATLICVVVAFGALDSHDAEPSNGSGDDWETFETQFADYVAAHGRRRRRFPARR